MSVTPNSGLIWNVSPVLKQHPVIWSQDLLASSGMVWAGSPRRATSQPVLRIVAAGVAEGCGRISTFNDLLPSPAIHSMGTRSSGGGHRQNKYDGAVGMTRKSG